MINLNKLSTENLEKIQKFLEIVLNHIELFGGYNRLTGNKISLEKFKKENIDYYEALAIISGLGDEVAEQLNEKYKQDLNCFNNNNMLFRECADLARMRFGKKEDYLRFSGISEEELENYLIVVIKDLNKLRKIKQKLDKRLNRSGDLIIGKPEEKFNQVVWWILQEIKKESIATPKDKYVYFEPQSSDSLNLSVIDQRRALKLLEKKRAISIRDKKYPLGMMKIGAELYNWKPIGYFLEIQPKFDELYKQYQKFDKKTGRFNEEILKTKQFLKKMKSDIKKKAKKQQQFEIKVKDRQIWINDYFLSKPFAVGSNFGFFEYIRSQPANIKIERNKLPDFGGLALKEQVKNKGFIKMLTELGFKGEILKAFFPKRGKNMLIYRGDKITKKDLEKSGIKILLFIKELELAHTKNSPE